MTTLYYDVIVVGGGHAGCEAAHAAAKMGAKTCLVTMDMNKIGQMSCNPAVGGIAKGQIVREIDALGGAMGIVTDSTAIQFRMLNKSKGPAMWSPRAQCDRGKFIWKWREILDNTDNLDIWQDQVEELIVEDDITLSRDSAAKRVVGVKTIWDIQIMAPAVIITAGTFLNGLMHVGRKMVPGGRCAEPAALHLTESINAIGITSARMKTGTPVRIDKRSVHFEDTEIQPGENVSQLFSYLPLGKETATVPCASAQGAAPVPSASPQGAAPAQVQAAPVPCASAQGAAPAQGAALPQLPCFTFTTNEACHQELLKGLPDSPLYNGQIKSIGPRYCPSVETKLVTFPDRDHHPLFLEPEGTDTNEMYLNGFSSSMDLQWGEDDVFLKEIFRPGNTRVEIAPESQLAVYYAQLPRAHRLLKMRRDFTSGMVRRTPFLVQGLMSLCCWFRLACLAGAVALSPTNTATWALAAVVMLLTWIPAILSFVQNCRMLQAPPLRLTVPVFTMWRPIYNFLYTLRGMRYRKSNYTSFYE